MPITLSARKKMHQDKTRQLVNQRRLAALKTAVTKARKNANPANLQSAFSIIDQAAKKRIIHKNQAARLKSRLAKRGTNQKTPRLLKKSKVQVKIDAK